MPVSDDVVVNAYRFLFGREPENQDVIALNSKAQDWQDLRNAFIHSDEFKNGIAQTLSLGGKAPIGQHMNERDNDVEVHCSPEQLQMMFDGIARNWKQFGDTEPHWSVLTNPVFFKDKLPQYLDAFFAHGQIDVEHALSYLARAGLPATGFDRAMDFGCGVGRLTVALAPHTRSIVGVDISPSHLREAEKTMAAKSIRNAKFQQIRMVDDIDGLGTFDFIFSRIVLQHNPPPIMAAIYRKLLGVLRPGGVAVIQIPTYLKGRPFSVDAYLSGDAPDMEMNALPQHEIFRIIQEQGCITLEVRECTDLRDIHGISHTFVVQKVEAMKEKKRGWFQRSRNS
ncbi:class I SAM-dependent methyltransferase [Sphingobium sp. CAP-1]|uniref:class I SAM-dependent methyltransferase n=1 Tax=Sphingobium sp. CAP-1 TaxID=2676077 RepID=UPI0012BB3905|nr:class I SAM-dependent methyltransferase [Sphingobium sp. CAP-1]QGP80827.1 methyltransferase domain-containing protein [Sphingobium sp. CAP-1]